MPAEAVASEGEPRDELAASQKSSLLIAENKSKCQCNRWLCYPPVVCFFCATV